MFRRYKKIDDRYRVMMIYLLLNGKDISQIEKAEETVEEEQFGLKYTKIYAYTNETVNVKEIEEEIEGIRCPVICSMQSFELNSNAKTIYLYKKEDEERELFINDMNVVSPVMVVEKDFVISSNLAKTVDNCDRRGFMHFVDYVLKNECVVGRWHLTYKERKFSILYRANENEDSEILLYLAEEKDKTSTYRLAIYVIYKSMESEGSPSDNFIVERWGIE